MVRASLSAFLIIASRSFPGAILSARVHQVTRFRSIRIVCHNTLVDTKYGDDDLRFRRAQEPRLVLRAEHYFQSDVGARTKLEDAMPRNANKLWTDQDETRLRELAASGASLVRATAALRRSSSSVKRKALDLGLAFRGVKQVRADLRAAGVLDSA